MLKTQQKILKYTLVNPRIRHTQQQFKNDPHLNLYPVVGFKQTKLGALMLNKPNNRNLFTSQALDQMYRFLLSYDDDLNIQNIWLQHRGKMFSGGLDFKQLKHNPLYLDKLAHFAVLIGKINKPIFAKVTGGARNIAAYALSMFSSPIGTNLSNMRLDQTQKGFIPVFGGSHRLSRLPFQLGLYFALTGQYLDFDKMARLGFINGFTDVDIPNKQYRKYLTEMNLLWRNKLYYNTFDQDLSEVQLQNLHLEKKTQIQNGIKFQQQFLFSNKRNFHTKFAMNQYKLALMNYASAITPFNSFSDKRHNIINYFQMRMQRPLKYLEEKGLYSQCNPKGAGDIPIQKILPIFSLGSLKQIINVLKKDESEWAQRTLNQIYWKDPLASILTFELLRKSQKLSWVQALKQETKVAKRLVQVSQLQLQNHQHGSRYVLKNIFSGTKIQDIPNQQIQKFFNPIQKDQKPSSLEIPNDAMYPTIDYISIPDAPRTYLNNQFNKNYNANNSQIQILRFLNQHKIDYRNKNYNIDILRNSFHRQFQLKNKIQNEHNRIAFTIQNNQLKQKYKKQRIQAIHSQFNNKEAIKKKVDNIITEIFQEKFQNRFKQLEKTAHLAGKQSKMKIFKQLKNHLIQTLVINGDQLQFRRTACQPNYRGVVQFDQKGVGIFQFQRKAIQKDPVLSKLCNLYKGIKKGEFQQFNSFFQKKQKNSIVPHQLGVLDEKTKNQIANQKLFKKVEQIYGYDYRTQYQAKKYRELLVQASFTSEEAAGLLQWQNQDIQNTLRSLPSPKQTYKNVLDKIEKKMKIDFSENIKGLTQIERQRSIFLDKIEDIRKHGPMTNHKTRPVYPFLQDKQMIPKTFRKKFQPLLDEVLMYFSEKYQQQNKLAKKQKLGQLGVVDDWINWSISMDYTQFLKSDVEYIFSYLVILQLREILIRIRETGGLQTKDKQNQAKQYMLNVFGLQFTSKQVRIIDKQFISFLYSMLDMHSKAKQTIIMPQSKLLDFLNLLRITNDIKLIKYKNLSFESMMLLIARDRRRIINRTHRSIPTLGVQPQHTLTLIHNLQINKDFDILHFDEDRAIFNGDLGQELLPVTDQKPPRRLLQNFFVYMRDLQAILTKVAGKDNFVPQQLRDQSQREKYLAKLKNIVNLAQTPQQWLNRRLKNYIETLFEMRYEVQKDISKGDLRMFDKGFNQLLKAQNLHKVMIQTILQQLNIINRQYGSQRLFQKILTEEQQSQEQYLYLMRNVKNPQALKRFNNFLLTDQIRKDYIQELKSYDQSKTSYHINDLLFAKTKEELQQQKNAKLNSFKNNQLTLNRMIKEIFKYPRATQYSHLHSQQQLPDGGSQFKRKYVNFNSKSLQVIENSKDQHYSYFLSQIHEIQNLISGEDLAVKLEQTLKKVQESLSLRPGKSNQI